MMAPEVITVDKGLLLKGNPMLSSNFDFEDNPTFYTSNYPYHDERDLEVETGGRDFDSLLDMEEMQDIIVYPEASAEEVSQFIEAPAVKTEFNRIATPPIPAAPTPAFSHPAQLVVEESLNLDTTVIIDQDNGTRCYWHGKRKLYIKPGEEFSLLFEYKSPAPLSRREEDDGMHLEVYPVYEEEEHSQAPVLRGDTDGLGILEVVEGVGGSCEDGARRGVRVRAAPRRARLRVHMWDDRCAHRRREHLRVALYFILIDARGRCRGVDSIKVRVTAKPKRKMKDEKKKLAIADISVTSSVTSAVTPVRDAPVSKRPRRKRRAPSFDASDDEPLGQAAEPQNIVLQLKIPLSLEGKQFLETVKLNLEHCVQRKPTDVALFKENLEHVANTIRAHYGHF